MTLQSELAHIEAEIARLETIRDYLKERASHTNGRQRVQTGRMTAARAAEIVLERNGPMRTPDLLTAIREEGAQLANGDGLYKTLARQPERFTKVGRGVWALVK